MYELIAFGFTPPPRSGARRRCAASCGPIGSRSDSSAFARLAFAFFQAVAARRRTELGMKGPEARPLGIDRRPALPFVSIAPSLSSNPRRTWSSPATKSITITHDPTATLLPGHEAEAGERIDGYLTAAAEA